MSDNLPPLPRFLNPDEARAAVRVHDAPPATPITRLVALAGLSPRRAFRQAILHDTRFRADDDLFGYDFTGADLTGADVRGADFSGATGLDTAILTGVVEDPTTRWPRDLRPLGTLTRIPPGRFLMGTTKAERRREKVPEAGWGETESPRHEVVFAQGFCLGRYPVTVGEYRRFVAETGHDTSGAAYGWNAEKQEFERSDRFGWANPGFPQDDRHPVTCVSHADATAYVEWLARKTSKPYRLPTEAEWEYACRAGTKTARFWGDDRERAAEYANVADHSLALAMGRDAGDREQFFQHDDGYPFTSPVGDFRPNKFGLYDMLGNVWEWCQDHWIPNYDNAPKNGMARTTGAESASRVLRGGAWIDDPRFDRAGSRFRIDPRDRLTDFGFRVARTLPPLES
jgi:formylglycine-generating enzyme required for sulfatase activity